MGAARPPSREGSPRDDLIEIGKITKTVGLGGEVKVVTFTHSPRDLQKYDRFFVVTPDGFSREITVEKMITRSNFAVLKFTAKETLEEVEDLINCGLFIREEQLEPPQQDEYLIRDLIGLRVYSQNGEELGRLHDVL